MILKFVGLTFLVGLSVQTFSFRSLEDKKKIKYTVVDGEPVKDPFGGHSGAIDLCLISRKTLHALPSYSPPDESLVGYFKKEVPSMSSFRGVALELVENFFGSYHDPQIQKGQVPLVENLVAIKNKYYTKFSNSVYTGNEEFVRELRETADLLTEAKRRKNKLETDKTVIMKEIKSLMLKVTLLAHEDQFKNQIKTKLREYNEVAMKISEIEMFYQSDEYYKEFRNFLYNNFNDSTALMFHTHKMRYYHETVEHLEKLLSQVNSVLYIYESINEYTNGQGGYDGLKSKIKMLTGFGELLSKEIDKFKKKIDKRKKKLKKKLKDLLGTKLTYFNKNEKYKKYEKNLKKVVSLWRTIKRIENELAELESNISEYRDTLGTTNYRFMDNRDLRNFIIPTKLKTMLRIEQKDINEFLSVQSLFHMNTLFEDKDINDIFKNSAISQNAITNLTQRLDELQEQLKLIEIIENEESKIDAYLGKIFRILLTEMGDFTCFSKVEVTYIIFMMIKTNIVIDSNRFFMAFFNGMSYEDSMKFIMFNYSITMNRGFLKDYVKQVRYKAGIDFDHIFFSNLQDEFVKSFTRMCNLYKALTGYRIESLDSKQEKMGFGMRLLQAVVSNYDFLWDSGTAPSKAIYFTAILEEAFGCIPWLGNIPGFKQLATMLLMFIVKKVVLLIIKSLPDAGTFFKSSFKFLRDLVSSDSDLIGLDWQNYVNDELQVDKEIQLASASVKEKISQIETVYYESLQENKFVHTKIDNFDVYKSYFDEVYDSETNSLLYKFLGLYDEKFANITEIESKEDFEFHETLAIMEEFEEMELSMESPDLELYEDFNKDHYMPTNENEKKFKSMFEEPLKLVYDNKLMNIPVEMDELDEQVQKIPNDLDFADYLELVSKDYHQPPGENEQAPRKNMPLKFSQVFKPETTYSNFKNFQYRGNKLEFVEEIIVSLGLIRDSDNEDQQKIVMENFITLKLNPLRRIRKNRNLKDEFFQKTTFNQNI